MLNDVKIKILNKNIEKLPQFKSSVKK